MSATQELTFPDEHGTYLYHLGASLPPREQGPRLVAQRALPRDIFRQRCPFRGPFNQLMRQHLVAAYLRQNPCVDGVFVAALHFRGNIKLDRLPLYHKKLAGGVTDLWNRMLAGVPKMQSMYVEDIVDSMRSIRNLELSGLLEYLEERYGYGW